MKILQINKFYYLRGGSERYFFDLSKILSQHGHKVIPFSMRDDNNKPDKYSRYFADKVSLREFSLKNIFKFFYNYDAIKKLKKLIKDEKPDIAHLHNIAHQLSPAIIKVLKKNSIPMVQTLHDYKLICPNAKLFSQGQYCEKCRGKKYYQCFLGKCMHNSLAKSFLGMLEAYLYNRIFKIYGQVDLFIAPSYFMKDICACFGVPKNKIKVVYNFIDADEFTSASLDYSDNYLLYFGRLSKEKGIDILIEAMRKVNVNVKLKIVGAGPEFKILETKIKDSDMEAKIELLGPKYGQALKDLIKNAQAIVIPSIWPENMPYSMLESMAAGKAVIASRTGGMPELIKDNVNGFLFTPGNSDELARKIDMLENFDLAEIGRKARQVTLPLSKENSYFEIMKIYQKFA